MGGEGILFLKNHCYIYTANGIIKCFR